ncbi:isoleucine--tRNA ligase, mitochondrial [Bombyx mori]|uniref:isoleucine--tRNA ligase n=1 Tax=Bombyx mori TaxID=7091 RepID=A0A8R1WH97_BOMMO|nr:isoleucine--tRNA ligase, mitochondrial [Bombyx mori]
MFLNSVTKRRNYGILLTKWDCKSCVRLKSSAEPKTKTYSHTVLTPKTKFPVRSTAVVKDEIQKSAQFSELYSWQRENLKGSEFVLHDGPPYANGDLHMGHAVNKIIKDINNRSQILQGNKVHYTPGWDCHGLPIELKALQKSKKSSTGTDPIAIRTTARSFALETVEKQKQAFISWGIMADWENHSYLTLKNNYVKNQLHLFHKMYEKGYIYRALKPVYWSPSSRTALAEAELEYDPQYRSTEVYVTFPIEKAPGCVSDYVNGMPLSAIIWTTTPWTLPANRAICYNPQMMYSIVKLSNRPGQFLVATSLIGSLEQILSIEIKKIIEFDGAQLEGTSYRHALVNEVLPFLPGDHVTAGKGTGLVHTAPAHGPDDFLVALRNNMRVECKVDEAGRYTNLDPQLDGLHVLSEGQEEVVKRLGSSVIHRGVYTHSYPLDWRTKKPIIIRASEQWFIDTAKLKEPALRALDSVDILPPSSSAQSRQGFRAQLEKRPYWCISRQRAWGVPIPALYADGDVIVDIGVIDKLCALIDKEGTDTWWTCDVKSLLPDDLLKSLSDRQIEKGKDIMDIWLDSGLSWSTLDGRTADLYCEGVDQLTGWFQASLLTSLALNEKPPYKSIFVHGFVVDENKRKMSKSIGNVIDPDAIINGSKGKNQSAYGVDTLRWWVASHSTQHSHIIISRNLLDDCRSEVIRIRNILKYLLGVISDLDKTDFYREPNLNYFDGYMRKETDEFLKRIEDHYNNYRYNNVAQAILNFVSSKVSALYCHCVKDRLYCARRGSDERLSAQLVVHAILVSLSKAIAPILPHLIEEAWRYHPLYEKPFFMTPDIPVLPVKPIETHLMNSILEIKREICVITKNEDLKRFCANIKLSNDLFGELNPLNRSDSDSDSVLCEILELSSVKLHPSSDVRLFEVELSQSSRDQCLRCRKYTATVNSDKCTRCENVLDLL